MAGLMTELTELLEDHADCVDRLIELAGETKAAVIRNDLQGLKEVLKQENEAVGRAQRFEKRRAALFSDIGIVLNRPTDGLTLGELCNIAKGQPESVRLEAVTDRLRTGMDALKTANDFNRGLVQNALDYIDFSVNVMRTTFIDEMTDYAETGRGGIDTRS